MDLFSRDLKAVTVRHCLNILKIEFLDYFVKLCQKAVGSNAEANK